MDTTTWLVCMVVVLSCVAAVLAVRVRRLARRIARLTCESLEAHARRAVDYAEQLGGTGAEKLRHALEASMRFDADVNGRRDWTDAQHRIAIEAEVRRRKESRHG